MEINEQSMQLNAQINERNEINEKSMKTLINQ